MTSFRRLCSVTTGFVLAILAILSATSRGSQSSAQENSGWGFSRSNLDETCKPCDDFSQYTMGGWIKNHPIPAEYPSWSTSAELNNKNQEALKEILERAQTAKASKGSNEQKIGDFYASCMDSSAIDAAGTKPLASDFAAIASIKDAKELATVIGKLHAEGTRAIFRFSSSQDYKDSSKTIGDAEQGGLGLPDRDYYTREDDKSKQLRAQYLAHARRLG